MVYRVFCRYFGFAADWENWGENDRMSEGVGGREGKGAPSASIDSSLIGTEGTTDVK